MDDLTRRRMEHNEQLFRAVNEEIDERSEARGDIDYLCECADASCSETVRIAHAEYEGVRDEPDRYLVLEGHAVPELEDVLEQHDGWLVVRKR